MITITVDPQSSAILFQTPLIPVFGCSPTSMSTSTPPLTRNPNPSRSGINPRIIYSEYPSTSPSIYCSMTNMIQVPCWWAWHDYMIFRLPVASGECALRSHYFALITISTLNTVTIQSFVFGLLVGNSLNQKFSNITIRYLSPRLMDPCYTIRKCHDSNPRPRA
jgi:hypothetical protein